MTVLINHHLLCVPHLVFVSVGFSSAVLVSQFHVQTQPPHQHLTVAAENKQKKWDILKRCTCNTWEMKAPQERGHVTK